MSALLGLDALGDLALGETPAEQTSGALTVRTQPTRATFPTANTRAAFPTTATRAAFPAAASSVTVPPRTTRPTFYTEAGVLVG